MFKTLLNKVKVWWANKPEEAYPLNDEPDPDVDTMREMVTPEEESTHWLNLFKIHF